MEYKQLGTTGIVVSRICIGTLLFGRWGSADEATCIRMVRKAFDAGVNFFDTSDVYGLGASEEVLGRAVADFRDDIVITTKFTQPVSGNPLHRGGSRRWIVQACEASLRRLRTDYIDVYLQHKYEDLGDLDETLGALSDLVRQGKVRTVGSSNYGAERIVQSQWTSERRAHVKQKVHQAPYSMLARFNERDVLPISQEYGIGVMTWASLGAGWLSGAIERGRPVPSFGSHRAPATYDLDNPANRAKLEAVDKFHDLARDIGLPLPTIAQAFVREHPAVTSAIVGIGSPEELDSALAAADVRLDAATLDRIDEIVPPGTILNPGDRGSSEGPEKEMRRGSTGQIALPELARRLGVPGAEGARDKA